MELDRPTGLVELEVPMIGVLEVPTLRNVLDVPTIGLAELEVPTGPFDVLRLLLELEVPTGRLGVPIDVLELTWPTGLLEVDSVLDVPTTLLELEIPRL